MIHHFENGRFEKTGAKRKPAHKATGSPTFFLLTTKSEENEGPREQGLTSKKRGSETERRGRA